jgi:NADH-quinone oxidoreductase subunit E
MALSERTLLDFREIMGRYPDAKSAIMPMLHLVQAEEGFVTPDGVQAIAANLDLSTAEVRAVASFYTMYRKSDVGGNHHIGVCINTMCGLLGGDAIYEAIAERLEIKNKETTADGVFTLERIECQAACTYSPVVTVDWEFFDNMDINKMMDVIDKLTVGEEVISTRGPAVRGWRATERTLAGIPDGLVDEGGGADAVMRAGLIALHEDKNRDAKNKLDELAPGSGQGSP